MPDLLVRNLSAETIAALKARAKRNNRSTQAEVAEIIENQVHGQAEGDFWARAAAFRKRLEGRDLGDSADLIREDRDSR